MFRQHSVADADHVEEGANVMLCGEFAGELEDGGAFRVRRRRVVVGNQRHLGNVPNRRPDLRQHGRPAAWPRGIMRKGEVDLGGHKLAHRNPALARRPRDDLLDERRLCAQVLTSTRPPAHVAPSPQAITLGCAPSRRGERGGFVRWVSILEETPSMASAPNPQTGLLRDALKSERRGPAWMLRFPPSTRPMRRRRAIQPRGWPRWTCA